MADGWKRKLEKVIYSIKYPRLDPVKRESAFMKRMLEDASRERILMELSVLPDFDKIWAQAQAQAQAEQYLTLPEKEALVENFITEVIDFAETYHTDLEVRRTRLGYTFSLSFDSGMLLNELAGMFYIADEIALFTGTDGRDMTLIMEFFTRERRPDGAPPDS